MKPSTPPGLRWRRKPRRPCGATSDFKRTSKVKKAQDSLFRDRTAIRDEQQVLEEVPQGRSLIEVSVRMRTLVMFELSIGAG